LLLAGCVHERLLAAGRLYTLHVLAGDAQVAPAGSQLPQPLRVEVRDVAGMPVKAAVVVFRVTTGAVDGATVVDSLAVTDGVGAAEAQLRVGARAGTVDVLAFAPGAEDRGVAFRATVTGGPTISGLLPVNVGPGDTLSIAGSALGGTASTVEIGSVRVRPVSGSDGELRVLVPDCLPPGSVSVRVLAGSAWTASRTATYSTRRRTLALHQFEVTVIGAGELSSCASLAMDGGAQYMVIPQLAAHAPSPVPMTMRLTVGSGTLATLFGSPSSLPMAVDVRGGAQEALDGALREQERQLAPLARGAPAYRPPMLALTLGSLRTFHVITTQAADAFTNATGQLRFIGEHLAIYVDTSTASAHSDPELAQFGRLFDTDIYRTVVDAFGPESDIDGNGKVLVFLTPRVNALVAATDCLARGVITGFFNGRDLIASAPNSNAGEIFYAMVPDPAGKYSCAHASSETQRLASDTFAHEMQHMISYFHHVLARGGDTEERWVNEGLSHISEELVSKVFEARYPWPQRRTTLEQIFPDSSGPFIEPQLLNSYIYLTNTANHSVTTFEGSGSMEERGAAWLFLRWLGDQEGESVYRRLEQTALTGIANVEAHTGEPFTRLFGDFTAAIWADSILGVPRGQVAPRYRFLSRNLRQLMAREAVISEIGRASCRERVYVQV
jgi:hypothetical protein